MADIQNIDSARLCWPTSSVGASTDTGQLVTFVIESKPVAEGTIVGHKGFIDAVMDPDNHTMHINVTCSRSVIRLTHVLVLGLTH